MLTVRASRVVTSMIALSAGLAASSTASAVNLLVNASFENPVVTVAQLPAIPGWTRTCGTSIELQNTGSTGLLADDGRQWWESDGVDNTCLAQSVPSALNRVYRLSLAHSPRPGVANNSVDVRFNGQTIATINANGVGNTGNVWTTYTYTVVSYGPVATVEIGASGPVDLLGGFVDDVQLEDLRCPSCAGDANNDGVVNFSDISAVLANFGFICP